MPFHHFHHFYQASQQGTDWTTILIGFAGAILGALIGGVATWLATSNQIKAEQSRRKQEEDKIVRAMLSAMHHELKCAWALYMDGSGGMLEAWPDNKPFMVTVPINTDNFIIYDEVAHNIGLVPNFLLRDKIIITYTLLKGLRNSYQFNNEYLEDMNRVGEQFALDKMNPEKIALVVSKEPVLIEIATKLKLSHNRVKQLVSELIVELKPYAEF